MIESFKRVALAFAASGLFFAFAGCANYEAPNLGAASNGGFSGDPTYEQYKRSESGPK
jgi:hypothetical protein